MAPEKELWHQAKAGRVVREVVLLPSFCPMLPQPLALRFSESSNKHFGASPLLPEDTAQSTEDKMMYKIVPDLGEFIV